MDGEQREPSVSYTNSHPENVSQRNRNTVSTSGSSSESIRIRSVSPTPRLDSNTNNVGLSAPQTISDGQIRSVARNGNRNLPQTTANGNANNNAHDDSYRTNDNGATQNVGNKTSQFSHSSIISDFTRQRKVQATCQETINDEIIQLLPQPTKTNQKTSSKRFRMDCHSLTNKFRKLSKLKLAVCLLCVLLVAEAICIAVLYTKVNFDVSDGEWSEWKAWTTCSSSCGSGAHLRRRTCSNPEPSRGGKHCAGETSEFQLCEMKPCAVVDGGWSGWGDWGECSSSCDTGLQSRKRTCSQPEPGPRGRDCTGESSENRLCARQSCIVVYPSFSVKKPKEIVDRRLTFSNIAHQSGFDFDINTGTFTASVAGTYVFTVTLLKQETASNSYCHLYKNNNQILSVILDPANNLGHAALTQSVSIHLAIGDIAYLGDCTDPTMTMGAWTMFSGFLLHPQ